MKQIAFAVVTSICLLVEFGAFVSARAPGKDAIQKELARFNGAWEFVSIEVEGTPVPDEEVKKSGKLVIADGKFTLKEGDGPARGTFKVFPDRKPKQVEVTFTDGPEKGKTLLGIYELEGDTYKVCFALEGKERPMEFVTRPATGHILEVLKRQKP